MPLSNKNSTKQHNNIRFIYSFLLNRISRSTDMSDYRIPARYFNSAQLRHVLAKFIHLDSVITSLAKEWFEKKDKISVVDLEKFLLRSFIINFLDYLRVY